ncbi:MAG: cryptochrome/photolyase family protein [Candidatus Sumerlaeia bacterium]|nr:cryptochrome/photolyase family protein [Candidatus Sumerlaeia bacterium]
MATFRQQLDALTTPETGGRRWVYVHGDQLSDRIGPLARMEAGEAGIVLTETRWHLARRPHHRQKLALLLANQRHFALEQARRGVAVEYLETEAPLREALRPAAARRGALAVMEPAEREVRADLAPLLAEGLLERHPHDGWLTTRAQFRESLGRDGAFRMDAFYRLVRQQSGYLMEGGKPVGGKYSFDAENREPWRGEPRAPEEPGFPMDAVKAEVCALVAERFARHPGTLRPEALPATAEDAGALWSWARRECLPHFGPYEDAMSRHSSGLFHTRLSPLMNIHRLLPRDVVEDALAEPLPLASKEGFLRQVLGWREYVRHVHVETDGFRRLPGGDPPVAAEAGDAGFARWAGASWPGTAPLEGLDGGAEPSALGAARPLPPAFWGAESGLACLDHVVADVWREGWSHHITRLMVLSNLATLLDVSPRELTDWFWVAYVDAFDWVVEPNVLGMGTYALGGLMTTKPYVSGTPYIEKMSDYCGACAFRPKKDCPVSRLYWAFLARNEAELRGNPRLFMPMNALAKRSDAERARDAAVFEAVSARLAEGRPATPRLVADAVAGA